MVSSHSRKIRNAVGALVLAAVFSFAVFSIKRVLADMLWVERVNTGHNWRGLAVSRTGQHLAAISNVGNLYLSDNYGADWTLTAGDLPGGSGSHDWTSIAMDNTGNVVVATENSGYIWVTLNHGVNWTAHGVLGNWNSASVNAAGGYEAAAVDTTDHTVWATPYFDFSLSNWSQQNLGSADWDKVAVDRFGGTLIATHGSLTASGYFAITTDGGTTWNVLRNSLPTANYTNVAAYEHGIVLAASSSSAVEYSTDNGQTWTASSAIGSGNTNWSAIATSIDGGEMLLLPTDDLNATAQVSADRGHTWSAVSALPTDIGFRTAAVSGDGTFMAAAGYQDIWTTDHDPVYNIINVESESATSTTFATAGDTVDVFLQLPRTPLLAPQVNILGHGTTTASNIRSNIWEASTVVSSSDADGPMTFTAMFGNRDATATTTVTSANDDSSVAIDNDGPVVTLIGDTTLHVNRGSTYNDPGATAHDASGGDLTSSIVTSGTVDTVTDGTYVITYSVNDELGLTSTATRTVIVSDQTSSGGSSSGGSVSNSDLAKLLVPSAAATAYLNSRGKTSGSVSVPAVSQIPPIVSLAATSTSQFTMDLFFGMSNHEVRLLQNYLNMHGFPVASSGPGSLGNETDRFGLLTVKALKAFQAAHGISPTGNFGPVTRAYANGH